MLQEQPYCSRSFNLALSLVTSRSLSLMTFFSSLFSWMVDASRFSSLSNLELKEEMVLFISSIFSAKSVLTLLVEGGAMAGVCCM